MREALISVIVPVYKVEAYLEDCLQSILGQTFGNLEVILVDDGSPDNCPQVCDNYALRDPRVKVVHKKNGGLSSARNAGMEHVTGDYVTFVDSDDWIDTRMYEILLSNFDREEGIGAVSAMIWQVHEDAGRSLFRPEWQRTAGRIIRSEELPKTILWEKASYTVWNKLFRRETLSGLKFKEGRLNEDWLFMVEWALANRKKGMSLYELSTPLYYYRVRPGSITSSMHERMWTDFLHNNEDIMKLAQRDDNDGDFEKEAYLRYIAAHIQVCGMTEIADDIKMNARRKIINEGFGKAFGAVGPKRKLALILMAVRPSLLCDKWIHSKLGI